MNIKKFGFALVFCGLIGWISCENSQGQEPGWSLRVVATGEYREQIRSTAIEQRPYRPLHFYGNTVRRIHYRGTPLPLPRAIYSRQPILRR